MLKQTQNSNNLNVKKKKEKETWESEWESSTFKNPKPIVKDVTITNLLLASSSQEFFFSVHSSNSHTSNYMTPYNH